MATEKIKAGNVEKGDFIHFPNSRHAQEVLNVEPDDEAKTVTLHCEETQWTVPNTFDIKRKVPDGDQ